VRRRSRNAGNDPRYEGMQRKTPLDFSGKAALVTGAASGMGLAAARAFAEAGAAVVPADVSEDPAMAEARKPASGAMRATTRKRRR